MCRYVVLPVHPDGRSAVQGNTYLTYYNLTTY
jgi:hypothetical protein